MSWAFSAGVPTVMRRQPASGPASNSRGPDAGVGEPPPQRPSHPATRTSTRVGLAGEHLEAGSAASAPRAAALGDDLGRARRAPRRARARAGTRRRADRATLRLYGGRTFSSTRRDRRRAIVKPTRSPAMPIFDSVRITTRFGCAASTGRFVRPLYAMYASSETITTSRMARRELARERRAATACRSGCSAARGTRRSAGARSIARSIAASSSSKSRAQRDLDRARRRARSRRAGSTTKRRRRIQHRAGARRAARERRAQHRDQLVGAVAEHELIAGDAELAREQRAQPRAPSDRGSARARPRRARRRARRAARRGSANGSSLASSFATIRGGRGTWYAAVPRSASGTRASGPRSSDARSSRAAHVTPSAHQRRAAVAVEALARGERGDRVGVRRGGRGVVLDERGALDGSRGRRAATRSARRRRSAARGCAPAR